MGVAAAGAGYAPCAWGPCTGANGGDDMRPSPAPLQVLSSIRSRALQPRAYARGMWFVSPARWRQWGVAWTKRT